MNKEMKKVPTVRFKGFTDDWEQRKLGELAEFNPREELPDEFEYVDLESVVGTEMISHRREAKVTAPSRAQRVAHQGDLFYQTVRPYQKNNYFFDKPDNDYVFSTGYAQMRPYIDGHFLLDLVQTERFVKIVLDNCTGTSYPAINANDLASIRVTYPQCRDEQQKIGKFLASIDNLLTLHQRKLDQLQTLKKYFLQNMFPAKGEKVPAIRFKGFMGDWEEHKFEDLFVVKSGYAFKAHDYVEKGVPIVNGESIKAGYISKDNLNFLPNIFISEYPDVILNNGDIVLGLNRPVIQGRLKISRIPLELDGRLLYQRAGKILFRKKVNHDFSYQLLSEEILKFAKREAVGSDQPFITTSKLNKWRFMVPEVEEQKKIGSYLNYLDNLITLKQRKLDQLQSLKKFMLQNLFI